MLCVLVRVVGQVGGRDDRVLGVLRYVRKSRRYLLELAHIKVN